ncbi:hypothetical protein N7509_006529 [Penicillium cosmopolitanum]|uniref:Uncharacterized protein n=1 Tax=Penicillium cosmopolitanum TaxID=1131564 RepID=A0A9X0B947_9EURO|nr:uncharacterized protein N7509_006529 [Penicillium cosmopolitanum]KAJ5394742.1 hypothetical protein N7509_006529 [Penicillium cosmopolitanum]
MDEKKNPDSSFGLLSSDVASSTGDAEAGLDELRQSPAFTNSEEIPLEECGGHSTAEFCESIQAEANEAVFTDAEIELSHKEIEIPSTSCEPNRISSSGRRSISMSPTSQRGEDQSKCNQSDKDANLPSVSELQSVVITISRLGERDMREIALLAPTSRPKRKRGPLASSHDGSCSDGSSDANDADDVSESSILPKRSKRAGRAAVQSSLAHIRHNKNTRHNLPSQRRVSRASKNEESHPQMPTDRHPISSLSDIETIPIRGFLTRETLLSKVVYSITFEERTEHTCLQEPDETPPDCERKAQRRKLPGQKNHQVGKSIRPARILSKDDELLIELKEEKGFKWKKLENVSLTDQWAHYRCGILHALRAGVVEAMVFLRRISRARLPNRY